MIKKMITHPGKCHRDDLLCMAVVLHNLHLNYVDRREPTEEELEDPDVLVVDVGMRHEPEKNNYDHHQLSRDAAPEWAFGLMLRGVFPQLVKAFESTSWFSTSRLMDSKGPFAVAKELEISSPVIGVLWSPFEEAITSMIGNSEYLNVESQNVLMTLGCFIQDDVLSLYRAITNLKDEMQVLDVGVQVLYAPKVLTGVEETALAKIRKETWPEAGAMVSWDNRGEGLSFYRFEDNPRVDFFRLSQMFEKMKFCHVGGFIAKTKERLDLVGIIELLKIAIK
jgi:hypothetical protein